MDTSSVEFIDYYGYDMDHVEMFLDPKDSDFAPEFQSDSFVVVSTGVTTTSLWTVLNVGGTQCNARAPSVRESVGVFGRETYRKLTAAGRPSGKVNVIGQLCPRTNVKTVTIPPIVMISCRRK
ncbi:uncharacterized protein LOC143246737 isoform X3 [Tachypleus tridentatus]|uniref:uncharacterized protein LOC143246737 isoform X3 n=1 Tax=Tachypleus tridentatus TaxID=6853 RepID=UPI003FD0D497